MNLTTLAILNGVLDLGAIVAVATFMRLPFALDRTRIEHRVYAFAAPLPEELAA